MLDLNFAIARVSISEQQHDIVNFEFLRGVELYAPALGWIMLSRGTRLSIDDLALAF